MSTGDIISVNTNPRIVPRLGLSYDVKGNGANVVHVTYGQYSGRYNEAQIGGNSPVGNPATISPLYTGPGRPGRATSRPASTWPTTRSPRRTSSASSAAREHLRRREAQDAARARVHRVVRPHRSAAPRLRRGQLHLPQTGNMVEDFTTHRRRHDQRRRSTASTPARSPTSSTATPTTRGASTRRWCSSRATACSTTDASTATTRCSSSNHGNYEGEGTNTPGNDVDHRRLSRGVQRGAALSRLAGCRTSSATSCAPGRSTTWTWAARRPLGVGPVARRLGPAPTAWRSATCRRPPRRAPS